MWDTVHGFELRTVYILGWIVVMASLALTVLAHRTGQRARSGRQG
jgi:hypothetical protein